MAKGAPDYYQRSLVDLIAQTVESLSIDVFAQTLETLSIDISQQSADRVKIFPAYGGGVRKWSNVSAVAGGLKNLITIPGRGVIYGGYTRIFGTDVIDDDGLLITIDGVLAAVADWILIKDYNLDVVHGIEPYVRRYDDVNYRYSFAYPSGITFDSSYVIDYVEANARTPTVQTYIAYALVE